MGASVKSCGANHALPIVNTHENEDLNGILRWKRCKQGAKCIGACGLVTKAALLKAVDSVPGQVSKVTFAAGGMGKMAKQLANLWA
eukprot:6139535-Pleurochrysis_carterae.AAC.2